MAEIAQALQTIEHVKTDFSQPVNRKGDTGWHPISDAVKGLFIYPVANDDGVSLITDNKHLAVINLTIINESFSSDFVVFEINIFLNAHLSSLQAACESLSRDFSVPAQTGQTSLVKMWLFIPAYRPLLLITDIVL
ncbi:hypothetical protein [Pantoea agglomerans]|uniref:hypothetical protein n=1 Tax=Enterobacter agglomerans TaxID=549 RepID=UPI0021650746|nr:hypothetical protein [Pantoea agglomerans]UVV74110.1 hypothetical protein NYF24_07120 [Pantoea agglomerans]